MLKFTEEGIQRLEEEIRESLMEQRDKPGLVECHFCIFEDEFHDGRKFQIQLKVTSDEWKHLDTDCLLEGILNEDKRS